MQCLSADLKGRDFMLTVTSKCFWKTSVFQWTTDHCPSSSLSKVIPELHCFWLNYTSISCSTFCKELEPFLLFEPLEPSCWPLTGLQVWQYLSENQSYLLPGKVTLKYFFELSKERLQLIETLLFMFLWGRVNIETKNVVQRENTSMKLKQEVKDKENTSSHSHRWENKQATNISTTIGKF